MAIDKPPVKFSGTDTGLLMRLEWEMSMPQLLVEIENHLQQSPAFFDGAQVLLEIGRRPVLAHEMEQLTKVLSRYGVSMQGVTAASDAADRRPPAAPPPVVTPSVFDPTTYLHIEHRTLRSGEKIADEGNVIILGDVNPGAEIIAGHNIFVWGSLKGSAYAGIPDHDEAVIAALHLAPIQLRIADYIARAPETRPITGWVPELARVDQGAIVVETWERGQVLLKRG